MAIEDYILVTDLVNGRQRIALEEDAAFYRDEGFPIEPLTYDNATIQVLLDDMKDSAENANDHTLIVWQDRLVELLLRLGTPDEVKRELWDIWEEHGYFGAESW